MDVEDIVMAFKNADPATKAAVMGALGMGAGGAIGGVIGGMKGVGIGGVLGGAAGAAGSMAIPKSGMWEKLGYMNHRGREAIFGKKWADFAKEHAITANTAEFAGGIGLNMAIASLLSLVRRFPKITSKNVGAFTGTRPGQSIF